MNRVLDRNFHLNKSVRSELEKRWMGGMERTSTVTSPQAGPQASSAKSLDKHGGENNHGCDSGEDVYEQCQYHLEAIHLTMECLQSVKNEIRKLSNLHRAIAKKKTTQAERLTSMMNIKGGPAGPNLSMPIWMRQSVQDAASQLLKQAQGHCGNTESLAKFESDVQTFLDSHNNTTNPGEVEDSPVFHPSPSGRSPNQFRLAMRHLSPRKAATDREHGSRGDQRWRISPPPSVQTRQKDVAATMTRQTKSDESDIIDSQLLKDFQQASASLDSIRRPRSDLANHLDYLQSQHKSIQEQLSTTNSTIASITNVPGTRTLPWIANTKLEELQSRLSFLKDRKGQVANEYKQAVNELDEFDRDNMMTLGKILESLKYIETRYHGLLRQSLAVLNHATSRDVRFDYVQGKGQDASLSFKEADTSKQYEQQQLQGKQWETFEDMVEIHTRNNNEQNNHSRSHTQPNSKSAVFQTEPFDESDEGHTDIRKHNPVARRETQQKRLKARDEVPSQSKKYTHVKDGDEERDAVNNLRSSDMQWRISLDAGGKIDSGVARKPSLGLARRGHRPVKWGKEIDRDNEMHLSQIHYAGANNADHDSDVTNNHGKKSTQAASHTIDTNIHTTTTEISKFIVDCKTEHSISTDFDKLCSCVGFEDPATKKKLKEEEKKDKEDKQIKQYLKKYLLRMRHPGVYLQDRGESNVDGSSSRWVDTAKPHGHTKEAPIEDLTGEITVTFDTESRKSLRFCAVRPTTPKDDKAAFDSDQVEEKMNRSTSHNKIPCRQEAVIESGTNGIRLEISPKESSVRHRNEQSGDVKIIACSSEESNTVSSQTHKDIPYPCGISETERDDEENESSDSSGLESDKKGNNSRRLGGYDEFKDSRIVVMNGNDNRSERAVERRSQSITTHEIDTLPCDRRHFVNGSRNCPIPLGNDSKITALSDNSNSCHREGSDKQLDVDQSKDSKITLVTEQTEIRNIVADIDTDSDSDSLSLTTSLTCSSNGYGRSSNHLTGPQDDEEDEMGVRVDEKIKTTSTSSDYDNSLGRRAEHPDEKEDETGAFGNHKSKRTSSSSSNRENYSKRMSGCLGEKEDEYGAFSNQKPTRISYSSGCGYMSEYITGRPDDFEEESGATDIQNQSRTSSRGFGRSSGHTAGPSDKIVDAVSAAAVFQKQTLSTDWSVSFHKRVRFNDKILVCREVEVFETEEEEGEEEDGEEDVDSEDEDTHSYDNEEEDESESKGCERREEPQAYRTITGHAIYYQKSRR